MKKEQHRYHKITQVIILGVLCFYSIVTWLNTINLSPDSNNYLAAGKNLAERGVLELNANFFTGNMEPEFEPYTEHPPGLPVLIALVMTFEPNPIFAALVVQTFAIILFYFALYLLLNSLGFYNLFKLLIFLTITIFPTFRVLFAHFWTETLFISLLMLQFFFIRKIVYTGNYKYWYYAFAIAFLASWMRYLGAINIFLFLLPALYQNKGFWKKMAMAGLASFGPVLIWLARNKLLYGDLSVTHGIGKEIRLDFFSEVMKKLDNTEPALFVFGFLFSIIILLIALYPMYSTKIKKVKQRVFQSSLILYGGVYLIGLVLVSFFAKIDTPDHRLLSPFILTFLIAFFYGIKVVNSRNKEKNYVQITMYSFCTLLAIASLVKFKYADSFNLGTIKYPPEKVLWNNIKALGFSEGSSHFYTGPENIHQLFSSLPQRSMFNDEPPDINLLKELLNKGRSPFFVINRKNPFYQKYDELLQEQGLNRLDYSDLGYMIYIN